jgi:hypothetical protein
MLKPSRDSAAQMVCATVPCWNPQSRPLRQVSEAGHRIGIWPKSQQHVCIISAGINLSLTAKNGRHLARVSFSSPARGRTEARWTGMGGPCFGDSVGKPRPEASNDTLRELLPTIK